MKNILAIIGLFVIFSACTEKEESNPKTYNGYEIVLGHVCGWCAGADSLYITEEKISYLNISYCGDSVINKQEPMSANEWNHLMQLFNLTEFLKININTCNVCADGCDTWIIVSNDTISHSIRFGFKDSLVIQPIQPFVDALHDLQAGFIE